MSRHRKDDPRPLKRDLIQNLADKYQVDSRTVSRWANAGKDLDDEADNATLADIATVPKNPLTADEKEELKNLKLQQEIRLKTAQSDREELRVLQTKKELVPIDTVKECNIAIGNRVKAQLSRLEKELPPMLCGLTEAKMVPIIRTKIEEILQQMAKEFSGE